MFLVSNEKYRTLSIYECPLASVWHSIEKLSKGNLKGVKLQCEPLIGKASGNKSVNNEQPKCTNHLL